jgi:hypothetical protein
MMTQGFKNVSDEKRKFSLYDFNQIASGTINISDELGQSSFGVVYMVYSNFIRNH